MLAAIATKVYRLGDRPGRAAVKMVNQLLAGVHIAADCEAMALGIRAGLDPNLLYEVISNSAGTRWMFQNRVPHILAGDYTPLSAVNIFVKDLGIVLDSARQGSRSRCRARPRTSSSPPARRHGGEDDTAVIKIFPALAGIALPGAGTRHAPRRDRRRLHRRHRPRAACWPGRHAHGAGRRRAGTRRAARRATPVVVALKSRTIPAAEAVAAVAAALGWLRAAARRQFYFKYCSTFDSTAAGNIGPVADALLDALGAGFTIACPAFPETAAPSTRAISSSATCCCPNPACSDHPLTPMTDPDLVPVLAARRTRPVGLVAQLGGRRGRRGDRRALPPRRRPGGG